MKRSLAQVVFGIAALTTCAVARAGKPHQWETATVISQKLTSDSSTVVVDTGAYS